mmetsp:Transcript_54536/g.45925  ORF Transcript_54536/g.45925 Transcript_54536/m.45925 type:complete len:103 (+) Transcript_54536:327-635(+)
MENLREQVLIFWLSAAAAAFQALLLALAVSVPSKALRNHLVPLISEASASETRTIRMRACQVHVGVNSILYVKEGTVREMCGALTQMHMYTTAKLTSLGRLR